MAPRLVGICYSGDGFPKGREPHVITGPQGEGGYYSEAAPVADRLTASGNQEEEEIIGK